jgi:uncharacterized protein (DUF952 family)
MVLYRVISEEEWHITKRDKKVPRCKSDERDGCVHLTKYEDVSLVASKYFVEEEHPVVIEIDITSFQNKIVWIAPTIEKPWQQPNAFIENLNLNDILRYAYLVPGTEKVNEFTIGSFLSQNTNEDGRNSLIP